MAQQQPDYLGPVREYLQLSQDQMARMQRNIAEFSAWENTKRQRAIQVDEELGVEAAREVITPGALGVRWAELETIRRQVAERRKELHRQNQTVLTEAQRLKFKAMEDAVSLDPVIVSARYASLLPRAANGCGDQDSLAELLRSPLIFGNCVGIVPAASPSMVARRTRDVLRP
jgi:hypothetical protein